jgi:hypothetical protein
MLLPVILKLNVHMLILLLQLPNFSVQSLHIHILLVLRLNCHLIGCLLWGSLLQLEGPWVLELLLIGTCCLLLPPLLLLLLLLLRLCWWLILLAWLLGLLGTLQVLNELPVDQLAVGMGYLRVRQVFGAGCVVYDVSLSQVFLLVDYSQVYLIFQSFLGYLLVPSE